MEQPILNHYTKNQKGNNQEKLDKMWEKISVSIKRYYPSNIKMIPSLGSLAKKYKLNRNTVKMYILINLEKEKRQDSAYNIYTEIWNRSLKKTQVRYSEFLKIIEDQFERHYPKNLEYILGINTIQKKIGASKITIIELCKMYLKSKFGEKQMYLIYEKIWGSKFALKNK